MRDHFQDDARVQEVSRNIIEELRDKELLSKESFLKKGLRKEVRKTIRENIIRNFGLVEGLDDIVEKIFTNLEEEYGRGNG
jgi:hypothetical protein